MTSALTEEVPNDFLYPSKFHHPSVIQPQEVYMSESEYLVQFPFNQDHVSLYDLFKEDFPSSIVIKHVLKQVVAFVDACYEVHVLHGDLRPENILMDTTSRELSSAKPTVSC